MKKGLIYGVIGVLFSLSTFILGITIVLFILGDVKPDKNFINPIVFVFLVSFAVMTPYILRVFFNSTLYESQKEIDDIREKYYSERDRTIKLNQQLMKEIERLSRQIE